MTIFELFLTAAALAMDAFAVSIGKGFSLRTVKVKHMVTAGLWFGGFQFLMPVLGYFLGQSVTGVLDKYDHWVAFILLAFIGVRMIREAFSEEEKMTDAMDPKEMFLLAVATSIDALAAGVSFALLDTDILLSSLLIGVVTFLMSAAGVRIGSVFGFRYRKRAEIYGGILLIVIGLRILLTGLGFAYF